MRFAFHFAASLAVASLLLTAGSRAASSDIVIHAGDITAIHGAWTLTSSTTGAGGRLLGTADAGWASTAVPLAAPAHYFDVTFEAPGNTAYQVWLRLRATGNAKWNDSVWVQFSDAVDAGGAPLWRIASTDALLVNLEDCIGCGVSGWGWQDNASWLKQAARVRFEGSGTHTLRVQLREDGVQIDQIVLSPVTFWSAPPGAVKNDSTIVPKPSATPSATLVRHPYLQQVTATSAIVVWTTRENGIADVSYSTGATAFVAPASSRLVTAAVNGMGFDYYQHEARLTNLTPGTTYNYVPRLDDVALSSGDRLLTMPANGGGTVQFIAFGDSGVGSPEQYQLAALMAADSFDIALHTGDVVYQYDAGGPGGYAELHKWFFDVYRGWLRRSAVYPAIGNHDDEASHAAPFRDVFVLPENGASAAYPEHARRFYSIDQGAAHIVVLDTELAFQDTTRRAAQIAWLEQDLSSTTQPWKIVVMHRSPYSAGGEHGSDLAVRAALSPIFEKHGVQLVISGHEHDYERTIPVREGTQGTPVVYVVTGGGGARLYPAATAWWTAASRSAFHYLRGAISECRLTLNAIGLDGKAFDAAVLDRCAAPPPPGESTPYQGIAAVIPGTVQAELFDEGGSQAAYLDATPGNTGGVFRATDVDIQSTSDTGGGYNVGWMTAGEWLAYTVDVADAGTFTVEARVAASGAGGTFHVEIAGVDVTGPMTIPNTGGWQSWRTISVAGVALNAGRQRLRVVLDANGSTGVFGNINYLRFVGDTATPYGGTAIAVPGLIQAEDFDLGPAGIAYRDTTAGNTGRQYRPSSDVDIETSADAGGGFNVGWIAPGEWLTYSVQVAASGVFSIETRVAANGQGGTFHVEVDGADVTGPRVIPNTSGWQKWTSVVAKGVTLSAGPHTLRVVFDAAGPTGVVGNVNYLRVTAQ